VNAALWFVFGAFVGFDLAIGYAVRATRRANKAAGSVAARVKPYVGERRWPW
jgi:hypothetical protein